MQTRVLGWRHGDWGKKNYPGLLGVKTDLLDWHVKKLTELRRQIREEQEVCRDKPSPTAFVTFKYASHSAHPRAGNTCACSCECLLYGVHEMQPSNSCSYELMVVAV